MKNLSQILLEKLKINKNIKLDTLTKLVDDIIDILAVRFENKWHPNIAEAHTTEFRNALEKVLKKYNTHKIEDFTFFTDYQGNITQLKRRYEELGIKENEDCKIKIKDDCFDYITYRNQEVLFHENGFYLSDVNGTGIFMEYRPNPSYGPQYSFLIKFNNK